MSVWWLAVIGLVVWVVMALTRRPEPRSRSALEVLEARLARGEISPDEYHQRRSVLEGR